MWQSLFADAETERPGTSVHTAKPSFPSKPSGLIHIASWEPSASPPTYDKAVWKCAS